MLAARAVLMGMFKRLKSKSWAEDAIRSKLPQQLANIIIPIALSMVVDSITDEFWLLEKAVALVIVAVFVTLMNSCIHFVELTYNRHEISKSKPITGVLQIVQIVLYIVSGIVFVAIMLGENPLALLGGIGAAAAVISFVFKDPILGFVAGLQLTGNDMVRIGDWIELPGQVANGNVMEISMTTVKVKNFDNSVVSIPTQSLVNNAMINWRTMQETGGRRLMRSIYVDSRSVKICDQEMLDRFSGMELTAEYLKHKLPELEKSNENAAVKRYLTNLGTFRAYMLAYLQQHEDLRQDMPMIVRQLDSQGEGIALQVYAFTKTSNWVEYEDIQSDIFDRFYSIAPKFELEIFQRPHFFEKK